MLNKPRIVLLLLVTHLFCCSNITSAATNEATKSLDKTDERIRGAARFLLDRANDNFLFLLESEIKDNQLLRCYFPNTYKYIATGDFVSLLRSKRKVWEDSVESDIKSIGEQLTVQLYSNAIGRVYDEYLQIFKNLHIKVDGKYYPLNTNVLPSEEISKRDAEKINRIINSFYINGVYIFDGIYQELDVFTNEYMIKTEFMLEDKKICAKRTKKLQVTQVSIFEKQKKIQELQLRIEHIGKTVSATEAIGLLEQLKEIESKLRELKRKKQDKGNIQLLKDIEALNSIVSQYEELNQSEFKAIITRIDNAKYRSQEVFKILKNVKDELHDKKSAFFKYASRLYIKTNNGQHKKVDQSVKRLISYLENLADYEQYMEFVKRKIKVFENKEVSFLLKVRAAEEILLCGSKDNIPDSIDKDLLDCNEDERVQLFNIDFESKEYGRFRRYFIFFAEVADADNADKVESLLSELTLPPVSYGLKRNTGGRRITISSYLGAGVFSEDSQTGDNESYFGLIAPVGVEYTFKKWSQQSFGIMLAPFDFAHPINLEIEDKDEPVKLEDIVVPGIYFTYGLKDSPLAIGLGYNQGRALRSDNTDEERIVLFLAFDMPLF